MYVVEIDKVEIASIAVKIPKRENNMQFSLAIHPRLFGLVVAHGGIDLAHMPKILIAYSLLLLPVWPTVDMCAFIVASIVHFARDIGWEASMGLHALIGLLELKNRRVASIAVLMTYMYVLHIPRVITNASMTELAILIPAISALVCFPNATLLNFMTITTRPTDGKTLILFTEVHQRIITCHVLAREWCC